MRICGYAGTAKSASVEMRRSHECLSNLENSLGVQVPMFVAPSEVVRAEVRTRHYLERVRAERKRGT